MQQYTHIIAILLWNRVLCIQGGRYRRLAQLDVGVGALSVAP